MGEYISKFAEPHFTFANIIVRMITFSNPRAHTAPLFQQLKILNVHQQCKFNTCMFIFDLKSKHFVHDVSHYFDSLPHNYPTRFAKGDNFYIPKMNLTLNQHSLKYAATKHWNSLPESIKCITSRYEFKNNLKNWLLFN